MERDWGPTGGRILAVLADGRPRAQREIAKATGLSEGAVWGGLRRCKEYHNVTRFVQEMREKGMGVLLGNKHRVLGTVIRSRECEIGENTRRELTQKLGLS